MRDCSTILETSGAYPEGTQSKFLLHQKGKQTLAAEDFPEDFFAEAVVILSDTEVLVGEWESAYVYLYKGNYMNGEKMTLKKKIKLEITEIWGATIIDNELFVSNGSQFIFVYDMKHLESSVIGNKSISPVRQIRVTCRNMNNSIIEIEGLNEFEFHPTRRTIWINQIMSPRIWEINPKTGNCVGLIDLEAKLDVRIADVAVAPDDLNSVWNGIAFLSHNWLLVTGKRFSKKYLLRIHFDEGKCKSWVHNAALPTSSAALFFVFHL